MHIRKRLTHSLCGALPREEEEANKSKMFTKEAQFEKFAARRTDGRSDGGHKNQHQIGGVD
jgi:hypothetical protein